MQLRPDRRASRGPGPRSLRGAGSASIRCKIASRHPESPRAAVSKSPAPAERGLGLGDVGVEQRDRFGVGLAGAAELQPRGAADLLERPQPFPRGPGALGEGNASSSGPGVPVRAIGRADQPEAVLARGYVARKGGCLLHARWVFRC